MDEIDDVSAEGYPLLPQKKANSIAYLSDNQKQELLEAVFDRYRTGLYNIEQCWNMEGVSNSWFYRRMKDGTNKKDWDKLKIEVARKDKRKLVSTSMEKLWELIEGATENTTVKESTIDSKGIRTPVKEKTTEKKLAPNYKAIEKILTKMTPTFSDNLTTEQVGVLLMALAQFIAESSPTLAEQVWVYFSEFKSNYSNMKL